MKKSQQNLVEHELKQEMLTVYDLASPHFSQDDGRAGDGAVFGASDSSEQVTRIDREPIARLSDFRTWQYELYGY